MRKKSKKIIITIIIVAIASFAVCLEVEYSFLEKATVYQGKQIDSTSVELIIDGRPQQSKIIQEFENPEDSLSFWVVTTLGVAKIENTKNK